LLTKEQADERLYKMMELCVSISCLNDVAPIMQGTGMLGYVENTIQSLICGGKEERAV